MRRLLLMAFILPAIFQARADTVVVLPFFNISKSSNLDWIGESISETIREALTSEGVLVLDREEGQEAYRRLSIRRYRLLTRASVIKIGEALDAAHVIYGQFGLTPSDGSPASSRGSLRITARILDRKRMKQGPEFAEIGALEDLATLQTRLAWRSLQLMTPKTVPSEEEFRKRRPPVRLDAMESYVRGLLAATQDQKHRFFTQAVRLDDGLSQACFQLGRMHWEKKDHRVAAGWLERVRSTDPRFREANFLLGLCRYHTADYAGAQAAFQLVARFVPLNEVFNNLGAAQSRRNMPQALENFRKALEGDPAEPDYHFNLGYALWKQGEFTAAAERFRAALDRMPEDSEAITMLGRCLKQSGPRPGDPRSDGLERLKQNYEEIHYRRLKAELETPRP